MTGEGEGHQFNEITKWRGNSESTFSTEGMVSNFKMAHNNDITLLTPQRIERGLVFLFNDKNFISAKPRHTLISEISAFYSLEKHDSLY